MEDYNRVQNANATRWNSQLHMIKSVLKVPENKLNEIGCKTKLSTYERKLLGELCTVLEPFEKATVLVQGEKYVTSSLAIPVTLGLKNQISKLSTVYNSKMVSALSDSVDTRLSQYQTDDPYILAALLDPRFKIRWCTSESESETYVDILKNEMAKIQNPTNSAEDDCSPSPKKVKTDDFFDFLPSTPRGRHKSGSEMILTFT